MWNRVMGCSYIIVLQQTVMLRTIREYYDSLNKPPADCWLRSAVQEVELQGVPRHLGGADGQVHQAPRPTLVFRVYIKGLGL